MQDNDRKLIFQDIANVANVEDASVVDAMQSMIYWTYLGLKEQGFDYELILETPIKRAEADFGRKYYGESLDADVQFDVTIRRGFDLDQVITDLEEGNPVHTASIYELLKIPGGVPINPDVIDEVTVFTKTAFHEAELATIKAILSIYLGIDANVQSAEAHVKLTREDFKKSEREGLQLGASRKAVIDSSHPRRSPRDIKHHHQPNRSFDESSIEELQSEDSKPPQRDSITTDQDIAGKSIDSLFEKDKDDEHRLVDFLPNGRSSSRMNDEISRDNILELLHRIEESVITTAEIAAVFDCAAEAAEQQLTSLQDQGELNRRRTLGDGEKRIDIWTLPDSQLSS